MPGLAQGRHLRRRAFVWQPHGQARRQL